MSNPIVPPPLSTIQHVILLMLENRSYDNILGALYLNATPPPGQNTLNGLTGNETNPNPAGGNPIQVHNDATVVAGDSSKYPNGMTYPGTAIPIFDPGEAFGDMAQQITGSSSIPGSNPYTAGQYPPPEPNELMRGFTLNYADPKFLQVTPPASNVPDVMNYLTPAQLPVTSFLAANYAVCDQWHASVPTQTFTNRVFSLCASPAIVTLLGKTYSVVNDLDYPIDPLTVLPTSDIQTLPSIFSQLDAVLGTPSTAFPNWKVYFHDYSITAMTVPYVAKQAKNSDNVNVATFDDSDWNGQLPKQLKSTTTSFVTDLANGQLPAFSVIEPRYSATFAATPLPPNSNHPGPSGGAPIDTSSGELFLMQLYNLLQASSLWDSTLLIITYDEHGGTYDHVAPPTATPPGTLSNGASIPPASVPVSIDKAATGFTYNVLGGRVPAILVSPLITGGSTIRDASSYFDHTSIIKTVWDLFGLAGGPNGLPSLTARDLNAPSLTNALQTYVVNTTGPFDAAILPSPGSLQFAASKIDNVPGAQTILAQGGPSANLSATSSESWLTVTPSGTSGYTWSASADAHHLSPGTYSATISFSGSGLTTVNVPVTFVVTLV